MLGTKTYLMLCLAEFVLEVRFFNKINVMNFLMQRPTYNIQDILLSLHLFIIIYHNSIPIKFANKMFFSLIFMTFTINCYANFFTGYSLFEEYQLQNTQYYRRLSFHNFE